MRDGAVGLSAGLFYSPQSFSTTPEVVELARVAARYGGVYDTHMRDESSYNIGLLGSVAEAPQIGRHAGPPGPRASTSRRTSPRTTRAARRSPPRSCPGGRRGAGPTPSWPAWTTPRPGLGSLPTCRTTCAGG